MRLAFNRNRKSRPRLVIFGIVNWTDVAAILTAPAGFGVSKYQDFLSLTSTATNLQFEENSEVKLSSRLRWTNSEYSV
ncbi:hypothetical protein EDE08_10852 [Bradyrhizobium sp. R2.2-H]|jgi:hypothetical protein|uniref:hypothetical protein n=1 Tax=unclassified Bradyrhizobium TaxID=2631580 RepID=UPI0010F24B96|nr:MULTISPECIES: hypothetical protein [unclassified Bradyrhizobium]TCU69304.1 hypothetical protein EDE10_10852 [Bradyrhizobium sp. Y-H1]TCU70796.1 hypothetical protein EDE08_10852 [Bradyrhizobium sp. R2.2-H]